MTRIRGKGVRAENWTNEFQHILQDATNQPTLFTWNLDFQSRSRVYVGDADYEYWLRWQILITIESSMKRNFRRMQFTQHWRRI